MLKESEIVEMLINTVNSIDVKLSVKDNILLCKNYYNFMDIMKIKDECYDTKEKSIPKWSDSYILNWEERDVLMQHRKFFKEFLKINIDIYNEALVNCNFYKSSELSNLICKIQGILQVHLNVHKLSKPF